MAFMLYKWLLSFSLFLGVFAFTSFQTNSKHHSIRGAYHPFYVSVTEIVHNKQESSIEVSCKIFVDDLENVLKQLYKKPFHLSDVQKQAESSVYLNDYITKHLKVWTDGKLSKLNYVGFEKESESVYCYFEVVHVPAVKKIDIENSILQDFTDQQVNIMHVTVNGKRQSHKLDFPNKKTSLSF